MPHNKVVFKKVASSQIKEIGYVEQEETLYIKFRNRKLYSYWPVSKEQYAEFENSNSKGSFFHKKIKQNSSFVIKEK